MENMELNNQVGEALPIGMPVAAAAGAAARQSMQSMENDTNIGMTPKIGINRDAPRYVVLAGDLMPDVTKRNWRKIQGSHLGGRWFDLTEVPCLWKFGGFVTRGRITPLIKKPVKAFQAEEIYKKKAEEQAKITEATGQVKEVPEVYRWAFPYDSMQSITNAYFGEQGFREVECLTGVEWDLRVVQEFQEFYFPNWDALLAKQAEMPFLLKDFEAHIRSRMAQTSEDMIVQIGEAFLMSADQFRNHAQGVADLARELFARGANEKGYMSQITPFARHLAAQLGINIDAPQVSVSVAAPAQVKQASNSQMSDSEFDLRMAELAAQNRANELKAIELGLDKPEPQITEVEESVVPEVPSTPAASGAESPGTSPSGPEENQTATMTICSATTKSGDACKGKAVKDGLCSFHQPREAITE